MDKICIFGFSRGAYTARALAGMIHKVCIPKYNHSIVSHLSQVGLLPPGNHQQVPFAYKMYSREDESGWQQSKHFKKAFSVDVRVDFLGAWYLSDFIPAKPFENNELGRDTVCSVGVIPHTLPFTNSNAAIRYFRHAMALDERRVAYQVNHWHPGRRYDPEDTDSKKTDVREVWFAGCHSGAIYSLYARKIRCESDIVIPQMLVEGPS